MQLDDAFGSKHRIGDDVFYAVLLHDHPELMDDCCDLINTEWRRSHVARLRSISGCSSDFPTSVLLLKESKKPEVIGHCKLSIISRSNPIIFVETVVIHPRLRGKGLGRLLMEKAEMYVKSKGIQCLYLSTLDKNLFYEKLGYSFCEPINVYGGQLNCTFLNTEKHELVPQTIETCSKKEKSAENSLSSIAKQPVPAPPPPPPMPTLPPPPPPPPMNSVLFMKKLGDKSGEQGQ